MKRLHLMVLAASLLPAGVAAGAADPLEGTWKENAAKSKYVNTAAPKSRTITYSVGKDGLAKWSTEIVEADGKSYKGGYEGKWDGKDIPVQGLTYDTIAVTRTGSHSIRWIVKGRGQRSVEGKTVASKDGKTLTVTYDGKDEDGKDYTVTRVFDRQ